MEKNSVLTLEQVKEILKPQFGYISKSTGEPLWLHSFSLWSIVSKMIKFIARFTTEDKLFIEIASLLHDIGKTKQENQDVLISAKGKTRHTSSIEEMRKHLDKIVQKGIIDLSAKQIDKAWEFAIHHSVSEQQIHTAKTPSFGIFSQIVRFADWLSSMKIIDMNIVNDLKTSFMRIIEFTVFGVGRNPSPSSYHLINLAIEEYKKMNWEPLVILDDGVVFIASPKTPIPSIKKIIEKFSSELISISFEGQTIKTSYIRTNILSGQAKENPVGFLLARKEEYLDKLSDIEFGPIVFFRTLIDLYEIAGIKERLRKTLKINGKDYGIIDILANASGTNGIKMAKQKWNALIGKEKDWAKVNDFIKEIFEFVKIKQIYDCDDTRNLIELAAEELFDFLLSIAKKHCSIKSTDELNKNLRLLINAEEETDFYKIAKDSFERYKKYKITRKPSNALCEQCGFPIPLEASGSLNFPSYSGFTQINPKPQSDAPRVVCPLCIFDVSKLRKGLTGGYKQVYARITSRVPELWYFYSNIEDFIKRIQGAFENPYELKRISETEFKDLPLPSTFEIPVSKKIKEKLSGIPIHTERGILFPLERTKNGDPKNLRAKFLALYSLLNLIGFETHIGTEEQIGLLGERIFETERIGWEKLYLKGVLINLLAHYSKKKNNQYIYAKNILEKSPSLVFQELEQAKIKTELLEKMTKFLKDLDMEIFQLKGGKYTMKELLQDAVFFAEGIPKYFWTDKDWDSWKKSGSKYVITKPVDNMLNALLQGEDFESAFAKFISGLRETIAADKTKEGSKAKYDEKDLKEFVKKSKELFLRYSALRDENISKFINAKNGLRSAIYIFKRYETLKEVV